MDDGKFPCSVSVIILFKGRNGYIISEHQPDTLIDKPYHWNDCIIGADVEAADKLLFSVTGKIVLRVESGYEFMCTGLHRVVCHGVDDDHIAGLKAAVEKRDEPHRYAFVITGRVTVEKRFLRRIDMLHGKAGIYISL